MRFEDYSKCYNKLCLLYTGIHPEYLIQLDYAIPFICNRFKELEITLCVKDDMVANTKDAIPFSSFNKLNFGYVREFKVHPAESTIYQFIKDAGIKFPKLKIKSGPALLVPSAVLPVKSLTENQISQIKIPYTVFSGQRIEDFGHIIGPENEYVFRAASLGIKTTLISGGPSTDLFKVMFPHGEILNLY